MFVLQIGMFHRTKEEIVSVFDEYELESIIKSLNNHKGLLSTFIMKKEEKILFNNGIYLNYEPNNSINIDLFKIKEDINKTELEQLFQENLAVFEQF